jgi:DNA modification methylase
MAPRQASARAKSSPTAALQIAISKRDRCETAVEMLPPDILRPSKRNARTHSKKQIRLIADAMRRFGVINPLVIDDHNRIVAGHARAEAAKALNLERVPVIRVSHLNEIEIRAYMLADNKLAEKAGWNRELLALEFGELQLELPKIGLDLSISGFEPGEVDSIISDFADEPADAADQIPEVEESAVSKSGDIFLLGRHRLVVGDCNNPDVFKALMKNELATMAFLDPPYNVRVNGHVGGRGAIKHREFAQASGEMTSDQFAQFLKTTLSTCSANLADGSIAYVCMDWRHLPELFAAGAVAFDELKNVCVWVKTTPGQGTFYRSQHELVCVYKRGTAAHINTFELGQNGRSRSNVWSYAGANTFRAGRVDDLKMHPTVKPVSLVADAMRDCSRRHSIVLDSFSGSGTTILAAEKIGRRAFCIEIDPRYVDVAIRRWQRFTGIDAILERTGRSFDELSR